MHMKTIATALLVSVAASMGHAQSSAELRRDVSDLAYRIQNEAPVARVTDQQLLVARQKLDDVLRILLRSPGGGHGGGHRPHPVPQNRPVCISRDNDGRSPFIIGIRDEQTLQVTRMSALVFDSTAACQEAIDNTARFGPNVYLCASRDADGKRPISLYSVDFARAQKLPLVFDSTQDCTGTVQRARVTSQVLAICASRDHDGRSPFRAFTINHATRNITPVGDIYQDLGTCQASL